MSEYRDIRKCNFLYYCKLSNGMVFESEDFKSVFMAVRRDMRKLYGHCLFYDRGVAIIYYGAVVEYGAHVNHIPVKECARVEVSSCCRVMTYRVFTGYGII